MSKLTDKIARIAFGDIVGRGIGFITTIYLARTLGAESYGLIIIALSFLGYATWAADLGLVHIGGREIAKDPEKRVFRAREIFYLKLILNFLVLGIVYITIPIMTLPEIQQDIILSFSFALIPHSLILEWYYNGKQYFGKVALSKIMNGIVYLLLALIFIKSPDNLLITPWLFIAGLSCSAIIYSLFSIKEKPFALTNRGYSVLKDLFQSALTVGTGTFFTQMLQLLPPIAIGFMLSSYDAGLYGAAIKIIFIAMILDRMFVHLLLPNLSAQWINNKSAAQHNIRIVGRVMLVLGGVLSLGIAISSPVIVDLIFGIDYQQSAPLLTILCILLFSTFLNSLFSFGLIAIGKDRQFFTSTLIGGTLSALLIIAATTTNNLEMVVIAVSVSEVIFMASAFYWFNKHTPLNIIPSFFISSVMLIALFYTSQLVELPIVLEAIIAVLIFIPMAMLFGILKIEHLTWIKQKLTQ